MIGSVVTRDFNLSATIESGQVFGFEKLLSGAYKGIIHKKPIVISQSKKMLSWDSFEFTEESMRHYFDLDYDLPKIYLLLDEHPRLAISKSTSPLHALKGLRLIRQDSWEALACFIISSNNNVKRIQLIYQKLILRFGGFPTPSQLAGSHECILRELGLGYRAPFLMDSARFLANNDVILGDIATKPYEEAREKVLAFPGIGPKVADCVLLYGFHKLEAFPVDVWIHRLMKKYFFNNRSVSEDKVRAFALKKWGNSAGYVQQYIFHGGRMGKI